MGLSYDACRRAMVEHLRYMGITDETVLGAMGKVERHLFIPEGHRDRVAPYGDHPCPIGYGQTISQPYIVAYMLERLALTPGDRVLEIGAGCGYVTAILHSMGMDVYAMEILLELYSHASGLVPPGVNLKFGNGYLGWPERAPFKGITGGCAPAKVPESLFEQLEEGGVMVMPEGVYSQCIVVFSKSDGRIRRRNDIPVRFVPMTGER